MIASQQALYAALHRVKDTIIITDDALRIQYTNKTTERVLGMKVVSLMEEDEFTKVTLNFKLVYETK